MHYRDTAAIKIIIFRLRQRISHNADFGHEVNDILLVRQINHNK